MREVHNKLGRNDRFFSEWNRDMAYVLGFITADGCIKDDHELCITIHKNDVEILEYIKKVMELEHEIKYTNYNNREQVSLGLRSKPIYEDLQLLNVTPRKTYTIVAPPFIPEDMFSHYMRGYWDGDGSISIYNHAKQITAIVSAKTASEIYARQLSKMLGNYDISTIIYNRPAKEIKHVELYELRICGKSNPTFVEFIYNNAPFYLKRKFDKFQQLYNGRFVDCLACGTKYYRTRADRDFCDRCQMVIRNGSLSELSAITNIPSETLRSASYTDRHSIVTNKVKELLRTVHDEDIVRSNTRVLANNEVVET